MWKLILVLVVVGALAMFLLSRNDIDMSGEKHGTAPSATHLTLMG